MKLSWVKTSWASVFIFLRPRPNLLRWLFYWISFFSLNNWLTELLTNIQITYGSHDCSPLFQEATVNPAQTGELFRAFSCSCFPLEVNLLFVLWNYIWNSMKLLCKHYTSVYTVHSYIHVFMFSYCTLPRHCYSIWSENTRLILKG